MTTRRRTRRRTRHNSWGAALAAVILGLVILVSLGHVLGWLLGSGALCAAAYGLGRRHTAAADPPPAVPSPRPAGPGAGRIVPPARAARAVLVSVSAVCAGGDCLACEVPGCQHRCTPGGHVHRQADDPVPF